MAIFIAILGFATVQMKAELPIVQADTVFAGFGGGSVSGIVFGPDGNTVILMHNATPTEIDIKTHKVLREFEKVPNATGEDPHMFFNKQKNYIGGTFYSTKYSDGNIFSGEIIWDYLTGKIIKAIPNIILFTDCNTERYYTYFNHNFCSYDFETFKLKDSFNLNSIKSSHVEWDGYGIIPNSNKVLLGLDNYIENESGDKTYLLSELYLLDFDTKKYTKIPIPYESGQKSSEIWSISVSQSGMYNMLVMRYISNGEINYLFYDKNMNYLFKENSKSLSAQLGIANLGIGYYNLFIDDNNLFIPCSRLGKKNELIYSLSEKRIKNVIDFFGGNRASFSDTKISMTNEQGIVGIVNILQVPVKEQNIITSPEVVFSNNQLLYNSNIAFIGESMIYDTTGKLISNLGSQPFGIGKNIIRINKPLLKGIYILTIKNGTEQLSYKFIVE
jgi:hypothetical protein